MLPVEIYGRRGTFYALLGGMPTLGCQPIGGIGGALALGSPAFTLGFGPISDLPQGAACDVGVGQTSFAVPAGASIDMAFRLQGASFSVMDGGLVFTRAVEVRVW